MRTAVLLAILCCGAVGAATPKQPKFFARRDYASGQPGDSPGGFVSVADVNGDGIPDVVGTYGFSIYTLLGNGDGTFRTGPITEPAHDLVVGWNVPADLNGDGIIDLVLSPGSSIAVCLGNGDGTFQQAVSYGVNDTLGYPLVGDFNGDSIPDVAIAGEKGIWLFIGKGGGVFNPGVLTPLTGVPQNAQVVAADFNGDGNLDLAVGAGHGFVVLLGNGNGTFQTPVSYRASSVPQFLAVGDINQDGHPDLALATSPVTIFLNNGKGGFTIRAEASIPCGYIAVGDINRDSNPDLVCSGLGEAYVAFGSGKGTFAAPVTYPVEPDTPFNVVVADLRNDGLTDIITGVFGAVSVLLNEGNGKFPDGDWISLPGSGNCGAAADFNGDGKPDLAVPTSSGVVILLGTGKASTLYTTGTTVPLSGPGCPITGDVNGDGIPDILLGANSLGGVGVYLGNRDGTFSLATVIPVGPANNLVLADFNRDGKLDFADSSNEMALGNGDGTFQAPVPITANPPALGFMWIAAGDVNNDGWPDIVATEGDYETEMYVLLNNQQGGFALSTTITNASGLNTVMLGDLNGDGNLDAVAETCCDAAIYLGNGKGGFTVSQAQVAYPNSDVLPPQIGDVNGDGIPDLLLPADGSIGIALGNGDGTFQPQFAVGAGPGIGQVFMQNLHGQSPKAGLPDLVAPDTSGGVTVLLNLTK